MSNKLKTFSTYVLITLLLTAPPNAVAQLNLLPDGGFESLKRVPYNACYYKSYDTFNSYFNFWYSPTNGTPDLYSTKYIKNGILKSPYLDAIACNNEIWSYYFLKGNKLNLSPFEGTNFIGLGYYWVDSTISTTKNTFYKEYIQTPVSQVKLNHKYNISFKYSRRHPDIDYENYSPLGFYFSKNSVINYVPINKTTSDPSFSTFVYKPVPQLEFKDMKYYCDTYAIKRCWNTANSVFRSHGEYSYVTIGFFRDMHYFDSPNSTTIYTFFDDVTIIELPSIVGPDTICADNEVMYKTNFKHFTYWSRDYEGNDTLTKDSVIYIKGQDTVIRLYAWGENQSDSFFIFVLQKPKTLFNSSLNKCSNSPINLRYSSPSNFQFTWSNGSLDSEAIFLKPGNKWCTYKNSFGCIYSDSFTIKNLDTIKLIPVDTSICTKINQLNIHVPDADSCWLKPAVKSNFGCDFELGEFDGLLRAKKENGCISETRIKVIEKCEPFCLIPNSLTPNGDGLNDDLQLVVRGFQSIEISIYNRWGQKVFETKNPAQFWKPDYKDMNGVYIIKITAHSVDKAFNYRSTIEILR